MKKIPVLRKPIPCYLLLAEAMNLDGESILFDDFGAATSLLPMCARGIDLAHSTIIGWDDISPPTSSIAGTVQDVPVACIVMSTDLEEVSTMIDLICYCLTPYQ